MKYTYIDPKINCAVCKKKIEGWYNFRDYRYQVNTGKAKYYFCSWTCLRRYKNGKKSTVHNERNKSNKEAGS